MEEKLYLLAFTVLGDVYLALRVDSKLLIFSDKMVGLEAFKHCTERFYQYDRNLGAIADRALKFLRPHILQIPDNGDIARYLEGCTATRLIDAELQLNHPVLKVNNNIMELSVIDVIEYLEKEKLKAGSSASMQEGSIVTCITPMPIPIELEQMVAESMGINMRVPQQGVDYTVFEKASVAGITGISLVELNHLQFWPADYFEEKQSAEEGERILKSIKTD